MDLAGFAKANSNFLKAEDIGKVGTRQNFTIENVTTVPQKGRDGEETEQVVLEFEGTEKVLGLNKTNLRTLIAAFKSSDSEDFIGKAITLYVTKVNDPSGKQVPAIRIDEELPDDGNPF